MVGLLLCVKYMGFSLVAMDKAGNKNMTFEQLLIYICWLILDYNHCFYDVCWRYFMISIFL